MENYDKIVLVDTCFSESHITYEEFVMHVSSGEDDWCYIMFKKDNAEHRLDGPAKIWRSGHKEWHVNGKLHRLDGPAVEWGDGDREWWVNGKRHRLDGPAVEYANGPRSWYVDGEYYIAEHDYLQAVKRYKNGKL